MEVLFHLFSFFRIWVFSIRFLSLKWLKDEALGKGVDISKNEGNHSGGKRALVSFLVTVLEFRFRPFGFDLKKMS